MKFLSELFENQFSLMDISVTQTTAVKDKTVEVGRYAAFSPNKDQKGHQVVEVSNDVQYLCKKYNVTAENICMLKEEGTAWQGRWRNEYTHF